MRYSGLIVIIITAVVTTGIWLHKQKKDMQGLGKTSAVNKPPHVRIVYSKNQPNSERLKVTSSDAAYRILKDIWSKQIETREEFIILLLDRSNAVLGYHMLSMGGITGTVADIRLLYSLALKALSTAIIVSHNHPSGNLNPSQADIGLTKRIKEAGKLLDITLLDHLIITREGYYSFADEGEI
jgi:DNA repair protein RadC